MSTTTTTISIEQLKPLGTKLIRDLNLDKEPVEDLKMAVKLLDQVLTHQATFPDAKTSVYFFDDFLGGISKVALKCFRFKNKEMVEVIRALCHKMTQIFISEIDNDNVDYAQRMRYILDPGMSFYRAFGAKLQDNYSLAVCAETDKAWRKELKKGDRVDVLKRETEPVPILGWTTGTVEDRNADIVMISYDGETDKALHSLPISSREIGPVAAYTGGNEWREALKKGDLIDCLDPSGAWYKSTVVETKAFFDGKADKSVVKLFVGYRTYQEDGVKKDTAGKVYQGWSSSYDEWVKLYSLRVQRPGTVSKLGTILCRKGDDEFDKEAVDDTPDVLLNSMAGKDIYCVMRVDKESQEYPVSLLNMFGEMGGFQKILARFSNKEKPLSFELAYYYFDIIGVVWANMHRKFAQGYIPRLQQAVIGYFETAPDVEVRKVQKERLDKTLKNLENLLRRVYSVVERCKIVERFELSMCTILLKSNYLQRRIDGLKGINDIVKFVVKGISRTLTPAFMAEWLTKRDIIDELLGPKKHLQTFQRSAQILSFLHERKLMDLKMMESLWNNTKDEQFAQDTFRVIKEISLPLSSPELEFFAGKIVAMPSAELCEEALDILYEPYKTAEKTVEQLMKYAEMLASIAFRPDCPVAMAEKALNKYADMVTALPFDPNKKALLARCVNDMLKKNENTVMALKLIRRVINQYSVTPIPGIENTKSSIVGVLLKDLSLLPVFFENFAAYYRAAKASKQLIDRYPHAEHVSERIDFLNIVLAHAGSQQKTILTLEYVYQLWEMLCEAPVAPGDSEIMYKFLKEIATDQATYAKNFDSKEGKKFFEEKMASLKNSYESLSIDAFSCIIQFFTLINEQAGHITVARVVPHKYTSYTSYSNVSGACYGDYSFTKKDENALPEVKTKVHPMKLDGTEIFWKIVQEAGNKDVVEKSRDFLNKLYTQVTGEIEKSASEIRGNFIGTYLEKLAALIESKAPHKSEMVGRMISLMMDMIDESERKGTGRLKSHNALLKGYLIDFVVHNNVTSGKTVPKKLEVQAYANTTVWELKAELGKYVDSSAECIKMSVGNKELKDTDNGKTIGELVKKRSGVLTLDKKNMDDIPKEPLMTEDFQFTEKARAAFADVFNKFASKEGKMDAEAAAAFIQNTTGEGTVAATDGRIKMLFSSFDKDKDGQLDLDGFLDFYKDAMMNKREDTVRQNLGVHGFRNDLKKFNEVQETVIEVATLPRYILSCNPKSFDLLFRILDMGESSAEQTWNLISRLTTNETIYNELLSLESAVDQTGKLPWVKLLDTHSTYRLLYGLQIIESFLDEGVVADPRKQAWRHQFIQYGGFEFLLNALLNADPAKGVCFAIDRVGKMGTFQKECLGFLGHILNSFIKAATFSVRAGLFEEVSKAQTSYKKHIGSVEHEDAEAEESLTEMAEEIVKLISGKANHDGKVVKEKVKEAVVDLKELFKAKPSTLLYLRSASKDVQQIDKEAGLGFSSPVEKSESERILALAGTSDFWLRQLDLLATLLLRDDVDFYDTKCIGSALQLFCGCVMVNAETFRLAKEYRKDATSFDGILMRGLLCPKSQAIREEFMDTLYFLCYLLKPKSGEESPLAYVLKTLLSNMPKRRSSGSKDCAEYFHLLCKLIDMHYAGKAEKIFEAKDLLDSLVNALKAHRTSEQRSTLAEDKLLIGMMNTIRKVLSHETALKESVSITEGLLHELFFNCLFPSLSGTGGSTETVPSLAKAESQEGSLMDAQKCKTKESRTAAYKLLATLCRGSLAGQSFLVKDCLEPLCRSIKPHNGWAYIPSSESRSKLGYSGIENLGCICYMNAMIQQFYMIPTLRYGLLGADDKRPPCIKKPNEIDDNVLHQMQKIFAFLELTERQDYNPSKFCYSFKDMDGKPTNTSVQQDAQEFLNLAFDRLENLLKVTPEKYLLQSVFGGKTCSQIICKGGCGNVRKNYEDFYNLSLGVKGFKTLGESLNKYISGETINEYYCENCMKKVDVVKRTCLDELPNVLIIHLQRIIYNYDTQMNEKINSRLEFPKELCIEPYTVEGVEAREKQTGPDASGKSPSLQDPWHGHDEAYYQYKLTGVLVHLGMADAGHYYSYINTNRKKGAGDQEHDLFDGSKDLWLEFNDSHIRSFDINKLESECFGGSSDSNKESGWSFKIFDHGSMKNAYMLVYERKLKTLLKRLVPKEEAEKQLKGEKALECENTALARVGQVYVDPKKDEFFTFAGFHDARAKVASGLFQEVWEDNNNFLFERQIYSLEFFKFVQDIFSESYSLIPALPRPSAGEIEASMTRIAAKVIYDVLAHAYYNSTIKPLTDQLIQLFTRSDVAANEFISFVLQDSLRDTMFILTKCPDKDARVAVGRLITEVILTMLPKEGPEFMVYEVEQHENRRVYKYKTNVGKLLYLLLNVVNGELAQNWPRFEQYFNILRDVIRKGGDNVSVFMNDKRVIALLIDFYLGADSPLHAKGEKVTPMGNRFKNPKFQPLITLVCILALRGNLTFIQPAYTKIQGEWKLPKPLYELDEEEKKCLQSKEFVLKTIVEGNASTEFADMLAVFCYESKKYSKMLAKSLLKAVNEDPSIDMIPYFNVLRSILTINDSFQKKRIEWLFGIGTPSKTFAQLMPTAKSHEQLKMGLCLVDSIRENVNDYQSVLTYNTKCESLLTLLWRHRKSFEIHPIRYLLDIMIKSRVVFDYVNALPPPTYQFAKYTDWIRPLVVSYPTSYKSLMGFASASTVEKNNNAYKETVNLLGEYEKLWTQSTETNPRYTDQQNILLAFPQPYLIGKPIEEKPLFTEKKDDITLVVSEIVTEVYQSLPTGKENLGVPDNFFDKPKEDPLNNRAAAKESEQKPKEVKAGEEIKSKEENKQPPPQEVALKKEPKPWKVEATVLKFEIRNCGTKLAKVKVNISAKVPEAPVNFYAPSSTLIELVEGQKWLVLMLAHKKVLGAGWGEFKVDWNVVIKEVKGGRRKGDFESPEMDAYHYYNMSDEEDDVYGGKYDVQTVVVEGKVCWNCKLLNSRDGEKCSRCGEQLETSYSS